jgi:hypothetical protein
VRDSLGTLVEDLLRGEIPLGKTYWLFGVLPGGALAVARTYLDRQNEFMPSPARTALEIGLGLLGIAYFPVMCVAIWRSSSKYQGPRWLAVLAKVVVVFGIIQFFVVTLTFSVRPAALGDIR